MKDTMSSLDVHFILRELQFIVGAKLDKVFSDGDMFLFQMHVTGHGKSLLKALLPKAIFLTESKEDFDQPNNICMNLRKNLGGARLVSMRQCGFERVIEFVFERKEVVYRLFIELFSKGNIVLCRDDFTIIIAQKYQNWTDRTIRGGEMYKVPSRIDPRELDEKGLGDFLDKTEKNSIVVSLAMELGFGGDYAEEVCYRADIERGTKTLNIEQKKRLFVVLAQIFDDEILAKDYVGQGLFPIAMKRHADLEQKDHKSFNVALDEHFTKGLEKKYQDNRSSGFEKKKSKFENIISTQEKTIEEFKTMMDENQKIGDKIYEEYQMFQKFLSNISSAIKEKGAKQVQVAIKKDKVVENISPSRKEVTINILEK